MKYTNLLCQMLCCTLAIVSANVSGDEFEDFIHSCERISKNYKSAVAARDSRFGREYQMYMKTMRSQAAAVQNCVASLQLGKDFRFRSLCMELEKIFQENKNRRFGKNKNISGNPDGILKILLFDTKELHKMEFTTEDGGSIKITLERKRRRLEMDRLARFFRQFRRRALQNRDPSLTHEFSIRCRRMQILARELTVLFRRKHQSSSTRYSLEREVDQLLAAHKILQDNQRRKGDRKSSSGRRRYKREKNKGTSLNRLRDNESPRALEQNTSIALRNIQTILSQWDVMNFMTDPPLKKNASSAAADKDDSPAAILKKGDSTHKDYDSMSRAALHKELIRMRQQIIKGNSYMDGFDPVSERKYVQTLTRAQKKIYQDALKSNKDLGYESAIAARAAVLKTQFEINMNKNLPEKKEMVRILEKIRKDRERSRGKINF